MNIDGIVFGCCFCGNDIEDPEVPKSVGLKWGEEGKDWQTWFCHLECFINNLHDDFKIFAWEEIE